MLSTVLEALRRVWASDLVCWLVVTGVVLPILRTRSPAEWVALAETRPRLQGLIKIARGAGFDPAKVVTGLVQLVTGKAQRLAPASAPACPYCPHCEPTKPTRLAIIPPPSAARAGDDRPTDPPPEAA